MMQGDFKQVLDCRPLMMLPCQMDAPPRLRSRLALAPMPARASWDPSQVVPPERHWGSSYPARWFS